MKKFLTLGEALEILQRIKDLRVKVRNELNRLHGQGEVGAFGERSHSTIASVLREAQEHAREIQCDRERIAALDDGRNSMALQSVLLSLGLPDLH